MNIISNPLYLFSIWIVHWTTNVWALQLYRELCFCWSPTLLVWTNKTSLSLFDRLNKFKTVYRAWEQWKSGCYDVQLKTRRITTTLYATEYSSLGFLKIFYEERHFKYWWLSVFCKIILDINTLNHPLDHWYFYVYLEFADQITHFSDFGGSLLITFRSMLILFWYALLNEC